MIKCSDIISSCNHNPNTFANNPGKIYADGRVICSETCANSPGKHTDCCYLCIGKCNTVSSRKESDIHLLRPRHHRGRIIQLLSLNPALHSFPKFHYIIMKDTEKSGEFKKAKYLQISDLSITESTGNYWHQTL